MSAERTIIIGSFWKPYFVQFLNVGFPGGITLNWRGKRDWCQPYNFLRWDEVAAAVQRRLELAGLALVDELSEPPDSFQFQPLVVRVQRLHRKLRKRAYEILEIQTPSDSSAALEPDVTTSGSAATE